MRRLIVLLASPAALAGCGATEQTAGRGWAVDAQAECLELHRVVGSVEPPKRLDQLGGHPSLATTRQTIDELLSREGGDDGLRRELRAFERGLADIQEKAIAGDSEAVLVETRRVASASGALADLARRAGAPECGDRTAIARTLDHARTPAYAHHARIVVEQTARDLDFFMREFRVAGTVADAADALARAYETADSANTRLGDLDAPLWARGPHDEYLDVLDDWSNEVTNLWNSFDEKRALDPQRAKVKRILRRLEGRLDAAEKALDGTIRTFAD